MNATLDDVRIKYGIRLYGSVVLSKFSYERPAALWQGNLCVQVRLGAFSYLNTNGVWRNVEIGRYSSLGDNAAVGLGNHPPTWVSTSTFIHAENSAFKTMTSSGELSEPVPPPKPQSWFPQKTSIGNDVWFGSGVTIPGSRPICIGNGAVVAARSVVTKDIPPYAVVAGNPAKIVKYRFDDTLCADLEATGWWNYDWTAYGNTHRQQWTTLPFEAPREFVNWWNAEGHEALQPYPILGKWYDIDGAGAKLQFREKTSTSTQDL